MPISKEALVEIDALPDLSKRKPIVILEESELVKLMSNLKSQKEPWIAMRFNDSIFVVWRELVFLHPLNSSSTSSSSQSSAQGAAEVIRT